MAKTWLEKFQHPPAPDVAVLDKPFGGLQEGDKLLISTPKEIAGYVRTIPDGRSRTVAQLRSDLAAAHRADGTCPLTTGIFLRIASELAWEEHQAGKPLTQITPFWRVVDPKSPLAKKLACGAAFIAKQWQREGL